ncbi:M14 family metallopeptidase [Paraglaciecola aestuariivivens]
MRFLLCLLSVLLTTAVQASLLMKPISDPDLQYSGTLLTDEYASEITHPDTILGFAIGQRVASPAQISEAINLWKQQSNRLKVIEYAKSHEGRPLFAVIISSPKNLANLEQIKQKLNELSDPRNTSSAKAKSIISQLPAVAWMAYSIHGNETSGADAALTTIYHLAASQSDKVSEMLDNMIVIIDPMMNPDGRARFAKSLEQYRGTAPNVDDQSLLHNGDWPYGRTNHYFFDLNRDFFYLTQPETIGRVKLINQWRPQLMIDGHEMGSQDTFLMGPPRQPLNFNIDPSVQKWAQVFSDEQSLAFDKRGWRYYTGEWFENWYPGYSNYAEYRGSVHILYEQSRMAEDGVRRPEGTVQTYKESVHHQFVSTLANLETLASYSREMYQDYWQQRQNNVAKKGPYANRSFVILANQNKSRTQGLVEKLLAQDIEVFVADKNIKVKSAVNQLGQKLSDVTLPAGSIVVPNRQPEARLLAAIMEFEAQIHPQTLEKERQKILREGRSIMYDTSAWNLSMMYGLEALTVPEHLTKNLTPYQLLAKQPSLNQAKSNAIAWAVNGNDDNSVAFAARLMEQGVVVRVLDKASQYENIGVTRGSVLVTVTDNLGNKDLISILNNTASELSLDIQSLTRGAGVGEMPDWGGSHVKLLTRPQIGLISHDDVRSYDVGATWWGLDTYLGIRHSQLDKARLNYTDLRRYNVLILPSSFSLSDGQKKALTDWVKQGGTLIAHDSSSKALAAEKGIGKVKLVDNILAKPQSYDIALQRQWLAEQKVDPQLLSMQYDLQTDLAYPWDDAPEKRKEDELKQRNAWQKLFMPSGAMVAGRVDQQHWLSFGVNSTLPLLFAKYPVLMAPESADAVVRVGVYTTQEKPSEQDSKSKAPSWYTLPKGQELKVRMSGLLWPEAAQRIANGAYLTRERIGRGQIILFAGQPNFRGATRGTNRLLLNAIVYGPGLGTSAKVNL